MACSTLVSEFTLKELNNCFDTYETDEEILDYLATQLERVEATSTQNDMSTDLCQKFLRVLSKALKCKTKSSKLIQVLSSIRDTKFLQFHTDKCLQELVIKNRTDLYQSLTCIVDILDEFLLRMPRSLPSILGLIVVISDIAETYLESEDQDYEWSQFQCIYNKAKILRNAAILEISNPNDNKDGHDSYKAPPNNFREISILPCISDIFPTSELYLRPIISKGTYQNLDHYLDVQFRLYREDCLHPLREGIAEYISQKESGKREVRRLQDVRLYKNVRITNKEVTINGLVYWVELDPNHFSRIRWESSKRLLYGSLVCLSSNDFHSLMFAIVIESDRDILRNKGLLKIQFSNTNQIPLEASRMVFTMVETTSYFEAYRHVLASLQKIQEGDLPFERYIVHCKKEVLPPFYLRGENLCYDLLPITDNTNISLSKDTFQDRGLRLARQRIQLNRRQRNVDILNDEWPSEEDLHLDTSQYDALKSGLTKEFVLIQGPPGTGKTHVGLQMVKILLHNRDKWSGQNRGEQNRPLLIVCFTNHALDQFMEGIIGFINSNESNNHIVRVGGQCTNPKIQEFALTRKRRFANYNISHHSLKTLQEIISKKKWQLRMSKQVILGFILKDCVDKEFKYLFEADKESCPGKPSFLPLYNWLGVTEKSWMTKSQKKLENMKQQPNTLNKKTTELSDPEKININEESTDVIDVKTDADIIREDRQIEEEKMFVKKEFDDVLGLDLKKQLNRLLKSDWTHKNEHNLVLIPMCANESLDELKKNDHMSENEVRRARQMNIWKMSFDKRWKLYRYWLQKFKTKTEADLALKEQEFKTTIEDYKRERELVDKRILQQSTVIAITTTAAARYQDVLREVAPKIILVEEAAEVLEAHIVSTLSSGCEHLVLIGDHKQLEPKPAVIQLARKYNLSLSMFERMIKNGLSYHCLQRQHRMRPEISKMVKHIYPILHDNENVFEYDHIAGVKNDVFFINHTHKEDYSDESRTYSNQYEAEFIPRLCNYLMKQGYEASQITVLAAYTGQMFCIKKSMPKSIFEGIRICVLDNYQGEENDIIILSLVRNNTSNTVGFLKRENRTCVALSRAKKGLYILGNIMMLQKSSKLWNKVFHDLDEMSAVGEELQLYCQNHPKEKGILAKNPNDFDKAPAGGCTRKCEFRHRCGHACASYCHPVDAKHIGAYKCAKDCPLICENLHPCPKKCHFPTKCECQVKILKNLPCGHEAEMVCCQDPDLYMCEFEVEVQYQKCKHETRMECWKSFKLEEFECTKEVTVKHPKCGHTMLVQCHKSENTVLLRLVYCKAICDKLCENKHLCKKNCHHPFSCNCIIPMAKSLSCGHSAKMPCCKDPSTHKCEEKVPITYPDCNHEVSMECWKSKQLHVYTCRTIVTVTHPNCCHAIEVECCDSKNTLRIQIKICKVRCNKICDNGHQCQKVCHYGSNCYCQEHMEKRVPVCGHIQTMCCCENPQTFNCKKIVTKVVPDCGHLQEMPCHLDPHLHSCKEIVEKHCSNNHSMMFKCTSSQREIDELCKELVDKELQKCPHKVTLPCNKSVRGQICSQIIDVKHRNCDHYFKIRCSENPERTQREMTYMLFRKPLRYPKCKTKIQLSCSKGHTREVICSEQTESKCTEPCGESLPCGHICSGICVKCEENKRHYTCHTKVVKICKAGHQTQVHCSKLSTFSCKVICNVSLACGHKCSRTCNLCMEGMLHGPCKQKCSGNQICGHSCFQSLCGTCRPCNMKCRTKCEHGSCMKSCAEVCDPCKEECTWSCSHMKCTRLCYEPCDREPCTESCKKTLRCGHNCLGYCGEPCPRLCQICDRQQFKKLKHQHPCNSKVFVVILPDCGHEFNSVYIDRHIYDRNSPIGNILSERAKCPICRKIIQWHPRYENVIKKQRNMIMSIKLQILQHFKDFPFKDIDDSIHYLKKFDAFCSRLCDTNDTSIVNLLSDVMPETDGFLSSLEFIYIDKKINHQQILDINCCMINIAIIWMVLLLIKTEMNNESDEEWSEYQAYVQRKDCKEALQTITTLSKGSVKCIEGRLQFLRKATLQDLTAIQNLMTWNSSTESSLSYIRNVPLMDTSTVDVHCSDWLVCRTGHTWSATFDKSKNCKHCSEAAVEHDESGDFRLSIKPIENGKLKASESQYANEEHEANFIDISEKNHLKTDLLNDKDMQRDNYRGRKRGRGKGSNNSYKGKWRLTESQMNLDGDRNTRETQGNSYYNFNYRQRDNQLEDENSNDNITKKSISSFESSRGSINGRRKSTEQQSNSVSAVGRTGNLKEEHRHGQGKHGAGEQQQSRHLETFRKSSSRQRGRGRGRPTEHQRNSDSPVGRTEKLKEENRKGQGEYNLDEEQKSGHFNGRKSSSGQRGRGREFRGRGTGRGRGRGRGRGHRT